MLTGFGKGFFGIINTGPVISHQALLELQDDFLTFQAFKNFLRYRDQSLRK